MKQESATFDQISDKCKIHKIQVKVIEKSRPFQNPGKKKFQRLLLQDVKVSYFLYFNKLLKNKDEYRIIILLKTLYHSTRNHSLCSYLKYCEHFKIFLLLLK